MIGDWEWENGRLVTVGLAHGVPDGPDPMLHVHTTVRDPGGDVVSLRIAGGGTPLDKDDILRRRREFAAGGESVVIEVGTAPVRFTVWRDGDRWGAAGHHDQRGLVLEARRISVSDVGLERINDLEPHLAGRCAHLRERRGEA